MDRRSAFLSTLSLRRATCTAHNRRSQKRFLSTLSLRRATNINSSVNTADKISIHALLAESDTHPIGILITVIEISIHALLAESDCARSRCWVLSNISIHALLAESDLEIGKNLTDRKHFYPRSPCGERPGKIRILNDIFNFYPRSPCGERLKFVNLRVVDGSFLSTLSLRRATIGLVFLWWGVRFLSTLSLRRATYMGVTVLGIQHNFYPRSPCGERPGSSYPKPWIL